MNIRGFTILGDINMGLLDVTALAATAVHGGQNKSKVVRTKDTNMNVPVGQPKNKSKAEPEEKGPYAKAHDTLKKYEKNGVVTDSKKDLDITFLGFNIVKSKQYKIFDADKYEKTYHKKATWKSLSKDLGLDRKYLYSLPEAKASQDGDPEIHGQVFIDPAKIGRSTDY